MKKSFSLRISKLFILMFFLLLLIALPIGFVKAEENSKITITYFRYKNYGTTHYAWIWQHKPMGSAGKDFKLEKKTGTSNEFVGVIDLKFHQPSTNLAGATHLGIIIKNKPSWGGEIREPGGDRFIDIKKAKNKEVFFFQDDPRIYYDKNDIKFSKITKAYVLENESIKFETSAKPKSFQLLKNDKVIHSVASAPSATTFKIDRNDVKFDYNSIYSIKATFIEKGKDVIDHFYVSFAKLYDTANFKQHLIPDINEKFGVLYTKSSSIFKVWAPVAKSLKLNLYNYGHENYDDKGNKLVNPDNKPYKEVDFTRKEKGIWQVKVYGDLHGKYYTFVVDNPSSNIGEPREVVDPYAFSTGVNGERGMIVDFSRVNPVGWKKEYKNNNLSKNAVDNILYEAHIRDLTTDKNWNGDEKLKGKFLGFAQKGTTYKGVKTGLDHIIELGVTTIHLLPIFDFASVDETKVFDKDYMEKHGFDWGYMPKNYNTLEGSYSTNPFDGKIRITEFKKLVQQLHKNNISVVMDVVFNHTAHGESSNFNFLVPDYYFRQDNDGHFLNRSGCGNDTKSERIMFRKFMLDSLKFYQTEYNINGFRFDIMNLHDIDTMKEIRRQIDGIIYGEGWVYGDYPALPKHRQANEETVKKLGEIGVFVADSRNGVRGDGNSKQAFIMGPGKYSDIEWKKTMLGLLGGTPNFNGQTWPQTNFNNPAQFINYISVHDDETLHDILRYKLGISDVKHASALLQSYVLTSQSVPILHMGAEILRTKEVPSGVEYAEDNRVNSYASKKIAGNSYNLPDVVNQIKWDWKVENKDLFEYVRGLMRIKREYPQLRNRTHADIKKNIELINLNDVAAFRAKNADDSSNVLVFHNVGSTIGSFAKRPGYKYYLLANSQNYKANPTGILEKELNNIKIYGYATTIILETKNTLDKQNEPLIDYSTLKNDYSNINIVLDSSTADHNTDTQTQSNKKILIIALTIVFSILALAGIVVGVTVPLLIKKKKLNNENKTTFEDKDPENSTQNIDSSSLEKEAEDRIKKEENNKEENEV